MATDGAGTWVLNHTTSNAGNNKSKELTVATSTTFTNNALKTVTVIDTLNK